MENVNRNSNSGRKGLLISPHLDFMMALRSAHPDSAHCGYILF